MSLQHAPSTRSSWLFSLIADRRSRVASLWSQIVALGPLSLMKPHVFRKFLNLLAQIAGEKEREGAFIDQIEAMEDQHHFLRAQRKLERANPVFRPSIYKDEPEAKNTKNRKGIGQFFNRLGMRAKDQNHY